MCDRYLERHVIISRLVALRSLLGASCYLCVCQPQTWSLGKIEPDSYLNCFVAGLRIVMHTLPGVGITSR